MKSSKFYVVTSLVGVVLLLQSCSESNDTNSNAESSTEMTESDNENQNSEETGDSNHEEGSDDNLENDILDDSNILKLVNKKYSLSEDYIPEDLVNLEVPTVLENAEVNQLSKEAADALKEMIDYAKEENIDILARSGYRSYKTQVQLFDNYVANHGEEAANQFSARPGESEHQTGLSIDVTSESVSYQLSESFGETIEGVWIKENAHKFGFIIRYPEGKEEIAGYQYEPWHLRYIGNDMAQNIYESGLTYEEYLVERGIDIEI
ncbi:D-alanyl-D-alanine carboxypeptidase family protein [Marinilactibacillus psychrotolerans]|uniref:M15 family metallopeptidase n=1 Tax=Marinilactibacillus psychrotolerans TaxID=191770 RepID=UPI00388830F2